MLIPLAEARLAATSCSYSQFFSVCFKLAQVVLLLLKNTEHVLVDISEQLKTFLLEVSKLTVQGFKLKCQLCSCPLVTFLEMQQGALLAEYFFS